MDRVWAFRLVARVSVAVVCSYEWNSRQRAQFPCSGSLVIVTLPASGMFSEAAVCQSCLRGFTRHRVTMPTCLRGKNQPLGGVGETRGQDFELHHSLGDCGDNFLAGAEAFSRTPAAAVRRVARIRH
jgi:hypothetical protein